MIRNRVPVLMALFLLGASAVWAQTDTTSVEPPKPEPAPTRLTFPDKPPAELAKLKFLEGSWTAKTHIYASPLGPESDGTSKATYRWGFEGMHLEGTHDLVRGGRAMTARSTWGWDPDRKQYQMIWTDALMPTSYLYYGTFPQESTLVVFATNQIQGKTFTEKMTMAFTGPNTYALTIENDLTGTMKKVREETGTRGSAAASKSKTTSGAKTTTKKKTTAPTTASKKKAG